MFDNLLLLSHGEMVYYGSAQDVVEHFASMGYSCPHHFNPADYLIDVVTEQTHEKIKQFSQFYRESHSRQTIQLQENILSTHGNGEAHVQIDTNIKSKNEIKDTREYLSSWTDQFLVLSHRTLLNNLRNPYLLRAQYIIIVCIALLLGIIFWKVTPDIEGVQNRAGSLFFMISLLAFGSMSAIDTCKDCNFNCC